MIGKREVKLGELLERAGLRRAPARPPAPRMGDHPDADEWALDLYQILGGTQPAPKLRPGAWDLVFEDLVIELDEEQHFNRYRADTLAPSWCGALPWLTDYQKQSKSREKDSLRKASFGGFWSNPSCVGLFGPPAPPRALDSLGGSPRWKQRALYDAMKDAHALLVLGVPFARLSVHDEVEGQSLGAVLDGRAAVSNDALAQILEARTLSPAKSHCER